MTSPIRQYTEEIFDSIGYWATWLPTAPLSLGDCGTLEGRVFDVQATLSDFDIEFEAGAAGNPAPFQYASDGGVEYALQLAGGTQKIPEVPQGQAGMKISFSRENAVVFIASEASVQRIANIRALSTTLMDRITMGEFPRNYSVVTEVVSAQAATILISSGGGAEFVVSAKAEISAGLLDLANASAGLSRVSSRRLGTEIVAQNGLTPLFKVAGLKRNGRFPVGGSSVGSLRFEDSDRVDFEEITPGEADPEL